MCLNCVRPARLFDERYKYIEIATFKIIESGIRGLFISLTIFLT